MTERHADPRVLPLIVQRWSPRSFDATPMPADDLAVIFEAGGLAPSAFNQQPWRFLYAIHGDANWDRFVSLLLPANQAWARDAGVLVFAASEIEMGDGDNRRKNHSHSFDTGAAWVVMALQATAMGYHAHGMTGVDFDRARDELALPDSYRLEAAFVIGRRASPDRLSEKLRAREFPSGRKPVSEIAFAGSFPDG